MARKLKVLTLNVHKGFSVLNAKFVLHELRDAIRLVDADLVFLQEVQGAHSARESEVTTWPKVPQYEFLADSVWSDYAYGKNAVYSEGHHGNAILSKFPIRMFKQADISTYTLEQRGLLHCQIELEDGVYFHAICVHLGLFSRHRKDQIKMIIDHIRSHVSESDSVIVAGDFNDWLQSADSLLLSELGMIEAHQSLHGFYAKTFPAWMPILSLDRVYVRHAQALSASRLGKQPWKTLSDHAALLVELELKPEAKLD